MMEQQHIAGRTPVLGFPVFSLPRAAVRKYGPISKLQREVANDVFRSAGPSVRAVLIATAQHFRMSPPDIVIRRHFSNLSKARLVAMSVVKTTSNLSLHEIGRRFGGFDHSTVAHAFERAHRRWPDDVAAVLAILDGQS